MTYQSQQLANWKELDALSIIKFKNTRYAINGSSSKLASTASTNICD
jgi:hypothetical protein